MTRSKPPALGTGEVALGRRLVRLTPAADVVEAGTSHLEQQPCGGGGWTGGPRARCVTACARAVAIDAHAWEGRAPEHHPTQVQHLAVDLAIIPG